jgi:hypothetical protein
MKKREIIEFVTNKVTENILANFLEIIKNKNCNTSKGITETIFIIKTFKKFLHKIIKSTDNINYNFEEVNILTQHALDYYKNNIDEIVKQFSENKQTYKIITDSVLASITIKLFENILDSCLAHIFNSKIGKFNLVNYNKEYIKNINKNRFAETPELAYPESDRPRGDSDLVSVKYHQERLRNGENLEAIWIIEKNGKRYILDGFHRLAASYIEKRTNIDAYFITFF